MDKGRRADDSGISTIEMLVGLLVITIGLFALLSGLLASAHSIVEQGARSTATRVATTHMESLRELGYSGILDRAAGGDYDEPATVTRDGRSFTVSTIVSERDASSGGVPLSGQPTVAAVEAVVSWSTHGGTKQMTFETAIAPAEALEIAVAESIDGVNVNPNPTVVDDAGTPTQDLQVKVILQGFDDGALVQGQWTNDGGANKTKTLVSADGGVTWTGTISSGDVVRAVPEGEEGSIEFTFVAGGLQQLYTLPVLPVPDDAVEIVSATVDPQPIQTDHPGQGQCNGPNRCQNSTDVAFAAQVTGLDTTVDPIKDTVRVKFELVDGSFLEVPLTYDPDTIRWTLTVEQGTAKFKPGSPQPFYFTAIRVASDGSPAASDTVTVYVNVIRT